jgi:general secretion pathway protein A
LYNEYFHFTELPFSIAPDPHFMFMSNRHQEGLAHLLYGINHGGGFVVLTGEVGTGKTTLCRCLLQQYLENVDIALILNPKLNAIELLATICDELRVAYDNNQQTLKHLVDTLNRHLITAHGNGRRTILIIDEAQNLSLEVLEQIRLLTNLETSKIKLLQIILVGQPELKDLLSRQELRQLNQRITARYHLLPLTLAETRLYVRHRLIVCKGNPNLFKPETIDKIFQLSKGIPRVINIICHSALLGAYATDTQDITPAMVKRAAKEALVFANPTHNAPSLLKPLLTLFALTCITALLFYKDGYKLKPPVPDAKMAVVNKTPDQSTPQQAVANTIPTPTPKTIQAPVAKLRPFGAWLDDRSLTLTAALKNALVAWGREVPADQQVDCNVTAQKAGLNCLFDKGNWKDMVAFNRPTVLEFSSPSGGKRYALLTSAEGDRVTFDFGREVTFSLSDVLTYWDGYYLLLWQSPKPGLTSIVPWKSSDHVLWLREQLASIDGLNPKTRYPRFFDAALIHRLREFQKTHDLVQRRVGAKTIIYLDNATGAKGSPHLTQD